jgi:Uma2 family endonuclease
MPEIPRKRPVILVPDWVCEVLSPGTEVFDRSTKADWFQEAGVSWLWFIDPETHTLEVYENERGQFRQRHRLQGDAEVCAPPFSAFSWSLGSLWE